MKQNLSQGRRLIAKLHRSTLGMTYMEMLQLGISVAPWMRVKEALRADEVLVKGKRGDLVTWRVKSLDKHVLSTIVQLSDLAV